MRTFQIAHFESADLIALKSAIKVSFKQFLVFFSVLIKMFL